MRIEMRDDGGVTRWHHRGGRIVAVDIIRKLVSHDADAVFTVGGKRRNNRVAKPVGADPALILKADARRAVSIYNGELITQWLRQRHAMRMGDYRTCRTIAYLPGAVGCAVITRIQSAVLGIPGTVEAAAVFGGLGAMTLLERVAQAVVRQQ